MCAGMFVRWHATLGSANRQTRAARYLIVRRFADWLHGIDSVHELMPRGLIPYRTVRTQPHIYSDAEIRRILDAAAELPSIYGLRALTFCTLFGLIAVTGLRISEALALDTVDLDAHSAVLIVRSGKLGKARLIPLQASVVDQLQRYVHERDRILGQATQALFVSESNRRIGDCCARYTFASLSQRIGLRTREDYGRHGRGPRIHDLRHSFAARTLINWYREGKDAGHEMIKLTTYLGHSTPDHTYWYLEAVPELLELASQRVDMPAIEELRP